MRERLRRIGFEVPYSRQRPFGGRRGQAPRRWCADTRRGHRAPPDAGAIDDAGTTGTGAQMDAALDAGEEIDGGSEAADAAFIPTCSAVTLTFAGTVATVADMPLGLDDSVRDTDVSGSFAYFPCFPDQDSDPRRGIYDPDSGNFSLSVGGHEIGGSGRPRIEVEDFDPDTFRWRDGNILLNPITRVMTVDGKAAPSLEVLIAITTTNDSGSAFSSDVPPTTFPFLDIASYPHTFSVQDDGGTLLLQLSSMKQK